MVDTPYEVRPLDESTWPAFAALVEANNGIFGGCRCIGFQPVPRALSTYERLGFERDRKIGKHRWVVSTHVDPSEREGDGMVAFGSSDDLQGARFVDTNLQGARFVGADLSRVVMRGVQVEEADIDAPWLPESAYFRVNGVDVIPYVEAELDRRFPGRAERRAGDPDGLRAAWAVLQSSWAATVDRAGAMPAGTVDISVDGEWSFAQTLRHLVLATDTWLRRGVLEIEQPYHPLGLRDTGTDGDGADGSVFTTETPTYDDVLAARADRVALVGDFLATVTADELAAERKNPHSPEYPETVRSCLHVILEEEWEHLRFAVRDLDAIEATAAGA